MNNAIWFIKRDIIKKPNAHSHPIPKDDIIVAK